MSKRASPDASLPDPGTEKGPLITVLVVTPHERDRVSLEHMLRPSAYSLHSVSNLEKALAFLQNHRADDLLWAEVLNLGGYDVLQTPFEANEVLPVVNLASTPTRAAEA